jgi:predicted RNA binding protein YcfA (HicA-like mRNA interferase family)
MEQRFRAPSKCLKEVIEYANANGWTVSKTTGQHLRFTKKGCATVFTSGTPSDARVGKNAIAKLRRQDREAA